MANFTERAIIETLNEMLKAHTIDKITVKDLTEACGISRNTFYYHFHDKYDVLTKYFVEQTEAVLNAHDDEESWENNFFDELRFFYENKKAINHIYKSVDREALDRFVDTVVYDFVRGIVAEESGDDKYRDRTLSLAAEFYKNALQGAVISWIDSDMKESPEKLAHLFNSVFDGTKKELLDSIERAI